MIIVNRIEKLKQKLVFYKESDMKLLIDLFTTDYGIMSISGIAFMLGMAVFFYWYFNHKMDEAEALAGKR